MTPDHLRPPVYDELRRLAAAKIRNEAEGHTLDDRLWVYAKSWLFAKLSPDFLA